MPLSTCNYAKWLQDQLRRNEEAPRKVYIVSSYIRMDGLAEVMGVFEEFRQRGIEVNIMSTFQRGITQVEAIEQLARLPNTKVYIFWNNLLNFHTKYSLFLYHDRQLDTALLGSSNFTKTGVGIGIEANVILTRSQGLEIGTIIDNLETDFSISLTDQSAEYCWIDWDMSHPDYPSLQRMCTKEFLTAEDLMSSKIFTEPREREEWDIYRAGMQRIERRVRDRAFGQQNLSLRNLWPFLSECHYKIFLQPEGTAVRVKPTDLDEDEVSDRFMKRAHAQMVKGRVQDAELERRGETIPDLEESDDDDDEAGDDEYENGGDPETAHTVMDQLRSFLGSA